jgi:zinc protease
MQNLSIPIEQFRLANGLTVILHHSPDSPVVALEVMYHVGSKNERPGLTGLAHLCEHIMFKGSVNVPDGGHFRLLQEIGAEVNGSTTEDRTTYYEVMPPEHIELALSLEADRMARVIPVLTKEKLENQRDVVKNERRQSYENQPYGLAQETLSAAVFPSNHPYSWPIIGSMRDLDNATLDDLRIFFRCHYIPGNAVITIGGRFDPASIRGMVEKYFAEIPPGAFDAPPAFPPEAPAPPGKITLQDNVAVPRVYLAWRSAPWFSDDDLALDIATDILGAGKHSRLYKALVIEGQLAQSVSAYQHGMEFDGKIVVAATGRQGVNPDRLANALRAQIDQLMKDGPGGREFQKVLNIKESGIMLSLDTVRSRVHQLALFHTLTGSAQNIRSYFDRFSTLDPTIVPTRAARFFSSEPIELVIEPRGRQ